MGAAGVILIVDDDVLMVAALNRAAAELGMATLVVGDGSGVVDLADHEEPDAILLDVNMPAADGRDILQSLKTNPRTAGIPVFIHSARGSHHDRLQALELGADDYFDKPFDLVILFRRIVQAIEKARDRSFANRVG